MKRGILITALLVVSFGAMYLFSSGAQGSAGEKKKLLRVGVYDSRGIAIAYGNSAFFDKLLKEKKAAFEQAKKDNDTKKVQDLEEWFPARQAKAHRQAFGTMPVHDLLEVVKDRIPAVAKEAGVDAIVSKWELDYLAADADIVDVTRGMAELFQPREKAYKWIEQLKDVDPVSEEAIEKHESSR